VSRNRGGTMVADLFARFGADTTDWEKGMKRIVTKMLFTAESLTQAGRILTAGLTVPMAAVGAAAFKTAMDFEDAMTKIVSLVGMSAETIERWKPKVVEMSTVVGKSAVELGEALFFITSNGIQSEEALRVLEMSAKGAAIGMGETKDVAFAATSAMNAYGEGSLSAEMAVATLLRTVREGNIAPETLTAALGRVLPVAAAMGVKLHEVGAAMAQMSKSGTSARLASFNLRSILMSIQDPTKGARDAMEDMEMSFAGVRQEIEEKGLKSALFHIRDAVEANDKTLNEVFPNQRAYAAVLQLLGKNAEQTAETFDELAKTSGKDVNEMFEIGADTAGRKMATGLAKLSAAAEVLGKNLLGLASNFDFFAGKIYAVTKAFDGLNPTLKTWILNTAGVVMATGPLLYAFGSLARIVARFTGLSILFRTGLAKNTAAILINGEVVEKAAAKHALFQKATRSAVVPAIAVGLAAWEAGKALDSWLGITERFNKEFARFGPADQSVREGLQDYTKQLRLAGDQGLRVAKQLGELALAEELLAAIQADDAVAVSFLVEKINKLVVARSLLSRATLDNIGETVEEREEREKLAGVTDAWLKSEEERIAKISKEMGLMTSDEVFDAMKKLLKVREEQLARGVDIGELNKVQIDDFNEITRLAKIYNRALPLGAQEFHRSLKEQGLPVTEDINEIWNQVLDNVDRTPGTFIEGAIKIGPTVSEALVTGFNTGMDHGAERLKDFRRQLKKAIEAPLQEGFRDMMKGDPMRDYIQDIADVFRNDPLVIDAIPNVDLFNQTLADVAAGRYPDTGG
jgi:TP901 family phage tail tape measure protein